METVEKYRNVIRKLLQEYQEFYAKQSKSDVETEIIADDAHGQYMVMRVGWRGETRVRRPAFYLRLKNDKIWVEEDWTEDGIATELVEAGVPHADIVLSFNPPYARHITGFAVA